jgi:alpha-L-rhamnosidase
MFLETGDARVLGHSRETRGSYGYMARQGLTTLPESWDAKPGIGNSMDHFMLRHLMEWHFAHVAGIRQQPGGIGWRRVLIAPNPRPLESASASFVSPAGRITVQWKQTKQRFDMTVTTSKGVAAEAQLSNGTRQALKPGATTLHTPGAD